MFSLLKKGNVNDWSSFPINEMWFNLSGIKNYIFFIFSLQLKPYCHRLEVQK